MDPSDAQPPGVVAAPQDAARAADSGPQPALSDAWPAPQPTLSGPTGPFTLPPARPLYRAWLSGLHRTVDLRTLARLAGLPYAVLLAEAREHFDTAGRAQPVPGRRCRRCRRDYQPEGLVVKSFDRWGRALPDDLCLRCEASMERTSRGKVPKPVSRGRDVRKVCNRCKLAKPLEDFGRDRSAEDGCNRYCKQCLAANQLRHRLKMERERVLLPDDEPKLCTSCKVTKRGADFSFDNHRRDGRSAWCRDCISTKQARRYRAQHGPPTS